jgi:hypothetical protein
MTQNNCNCRNDDCFILSDDFNDIIASQSNRVLDLDKEKRFNCYSAIAKELGYRQRQALPVCVVEAVREHFPGQ